VGDRLGDPALVEIFLASPSDVGAERDIAERVISRLDGIWKAHVRLRTKRWEKAHYQAIKGFQEAIGAMTAFDVVIGILWKRIGSPLPPDLFQRPDGSAYESGTVFEIESAIASCNAKQKPAVYILKKTEEVKFGAQTVDEEKQQYHALQGWWSRTFVDAQGHYRRGYQTYETLEEFEDRLGELLETHLREQKLIPAGPAWDIRANGSPYPGLIRYGLEYAPVYFGRSLTVTEGMEELIKASEREMPALFVVGPSGSGKSSLVMAGLVPQFSGRGIPGLDFWRLALVEPADDLMGLIATQLFNALPEMASGPHGDARSFCAIARSSTEAAVGCIKWALERAGERIRGQTGGGQKQTGRLLLVFDQLETILCSPDARQISALARALVENQAAWFVATLRSDCYAELQNDCDLFAMRQRGVLLDLPLPGASEISDIIKGPARGANLVFETREDVSLATVIRSAVSGPDALALLQMTLKRLFDSRDGNTLTYEAYEKMGGLEGAIAAHADGTFALLSPAAQSKLDGLLRSLVADIEDSGRLTICTPARRDVVTDAASRELVERMMEARLLVGAGDSVRIAHEALLRRWRLAVKSPALQPEAIRLRRQIQPNYELWKKTGLDSDLLQQGTALAAAERIAGEHPGAFPPELEDFIRRSCERATRQETLEKLKAQADARRAKLRASIAFAMVAVLAVISFAAVRLYVRANENFVLALLAKADEFLVQNKPSHARFVAESIPENWFSNLLVLTGLWSEPEASIRTATIAQIAGPAAALPLSSYMGKSGATAVAAADGQHFAAGFSDGDIILAPVNGTGETKRLAGHSATIRALGFSPDGTQIVSASTDHSIRIWNLTTGDFKVFCLPALVDSIAINGDRTVALASEDGKVSLFNIDSPDVRNPFSEDHKSAYAVTFSADGSLLASSGKDGAIFVRRVSDGALLNRIETGRANLVSVSFSPDAARLASASVLGPVDVWETFAAGSRGKQIPVAAEKRFAVRFSPDGRFLAVASWDGTAQLIDGQSYDYIATIDGHDHWLNDLTFATGSSRLITAAQSGAVRVWATERLRPMFFTVQDDNEETLWGRYSPDGAKFASGGRTGLARMYSVDADGSLHPLCSVRHDGEVRSIAFSPDGRQALSVGNREGVADNVVRLWDAADCRVVRDFPVGADEVYAVAYASSGEYIAWAHRSGVIELTKLDGEWRTIKLPNLHGDTVFKLDLSPDGKLLASAGRDKRVIIWNVAQKTVSRELSGAHQQRVTTVKFSPDGRLIASGGPEEHIYIWDLSRSEPLIKTLDVPGGSNELAFNQDGTVLAVGSDARRISQWLVAGWRKTFQLNTLVGVRSVFGFHPKRGDLAFDGENGLIRILPKRLADAPRRAVATLSGLDVHFDRVAVAPAPDTAISSPKNACSR
jgi:WD40 repeat protein/energy-coupling factor transporter ATP-binding protein EcfA2